jgi:hypothetical protein
MELWKKKVEDIKEIRKLTTEYTNILFSREIISWINDGNYSNPDNDARDAQIRKYKDILLSSYEKTSLLETMTSGFSEVQTSVRELHSKLQEIVFQYDSSESLQTLYALFEDAKNTVTKIFKACDEELKKIPEF